MRTCRSGLVVTANAVHGDAAGLLQRNEKAVTAVAGNERHAVTQLGCDAFAIIIIQEDFAGDTDDTGVDTLGVRQILPPDARTAAVGSDQHVALRRRAILKVCANASGRQLLVAHEGLAKMHAVQTGQQHLPQRNAAGGPMLGSAVTAEAFRRIQLIERKQDLHPLGDEADSLRRLAAGAHEGVEQGQGQTFVEREAAGRIDMNTVALQPVGTGSIALVDGDAHAGLLQALRQRQTTDATADDDDVERRRRSSDD